ncbi:hypothetical protein [Bufonid herpesvirus 1]|uniref:hypothetical protein n=1 Tax=Bufonid herpesvirus 1 TaxID=2282206 RepID=UPI000EB67D9C|nr:hypothetical protein [Bufonid herpesvirus 1]AXF48587.1 hypothetical protein [Bufonid herpesvirus 1]
MMSSKPRLTFVITSISSVCEGSPLVFIVLINFDNSIVSFRWVIFWANIRSVSFFSSLCSFLSLSSSDLIQAFSPCRLAVSRAKVFLSSAKRLLTARSKALLELADVWSCVITFDNSVATSFMTSIVDASVKSFSGFRVFTNCTIQSLSFVFTCVKLSATTSSILCQSITNSFD